MISKLVFVLCFVLITTPALGSMLEMREGWRISTDGQASSSGSSEISSASGDPAISLGIASSSSLYGPGSVSLVREGAIGRDIGLGGFDLSASFDGDVRSDVILESTGTAWASAFVGATAIAMPTGSGSY